MKVGDCTILQIFFYIVLARSKDCIIPGNRKSMMEYNGTISHGMSGTVCERKYQHLEEIRDRGHNFCRYGGTNREKQGPWCFVETRSPMMKEYVKYTPAERCDVPICGSLNINDSIITASSKSKRSYNNKTEHLTDGKALTIFSTDCPKQFPTKSFDSVTLQMKEVFSIRFVVLTPRQQWFLAVRAENITIFVKERGIWRQCGYSGRFYDKKTPKMVPCVARTQEIKLVRRLTEESENVEYGQCMELSEIGVIKNPNGWSDWNKWSDCSKDCMAKRTRICERIGYGGEPCGPLNTTETEKKYCRCALTTDFPEQNQMRKAEYYFKKGAPYGAAVFVLLVLLNVLALYCAWKPLKFKKQEPSSSNSGIYFSVSTPSSDLVSLSSSVTNFSEPEFEILSD